MRRVRRPVLMGVLAAAALVVALPGCTVPSYPSTAAACGAAAPAPARYDHVVVVMMENRTWDAVGGVGFGDRYMPYLKDLGANCTVFRDWTETNTEQNSLNQYVGLTSGVSNPSTVDDCDPSPTCRSTDDNLFRQVRRSGGTARTYVDNTQHACAAEDNRWKHIPAAYYQGTYTDATGVHNDHDVCGEEVRPLGEFDPDRLPTFSMIVPDQCNDGHDCLNYRVDEFAANYVGAVLRSRTYAEGRTAVMVLWDEDRPVPNLLIAPTARRGVQDLPGAGHAAMLRTWEEMLALPVLPTPALAAAPSLRTAANI
ncbi:MAG: alkaline phosphatase family protein [Microthrixaceae bacterium]